MKRNVFVSVCVILLYSWFIHVAYAGEDTDLAMKLANPVSSLISFPIQANYDEKFGLDDEGSIWRINIQPVIPFTINSNWNLISRTILPIIAQDDIPIKGMDATGTGDILQSLFFSPKEPTSSGLIWGVGPVFMFPTASDETLGTEKWGIGPTAVVLKQVGQWTIGGLANHIVSFAGEDERTDVNLTFIQPFLAFVTKTKTTLAFNTESSYDWEGEQWSVPLNLTAAQMLKLGKLPFQIGGGIRYWAESPDAGAEGWGARIQFTMLFPK